MTALSLLFLTTAVSIQQVEPASFAAKYEAYCLLSAPLEWPIPQQALARQVKDRPELLRAAQIVAQELEIMDKSEVRYFLAKEDEFPTDMGVMNRRFHDLKDAPKIWEAQRLPSLAICKSQIEFNRAYNKYVENYKIINQDRADLANTVLMENKELYECWDAARDAQCDFYNITCRRQPLKKLKAKLGEEDFMFMKMPPNVPIWRFVEEK